MTAWTPHITVATVVQQHDRFLMVEEHTDGVVHSVYNQPAGHVEAGETLAQAAVRETLEETGYSVQIDALLGIYTYTPPMFPDRTYYRICFLASVLAVPENAQLDADIIQTHWMRFEDIENSGRARSPLVIKTLQDALAGKRYPLDLIYEHPMTPLFANLDA